VNYYLDFVPEHGRSEKKKKEDTRGGRLAQQKKKKKPEKEKEKKKKKKKRNREKKKKTKETKFYMRGGVWPAFAACIINVVTKRGKKRKV